MKKLVSLVTAAIVAAAITFAAAPQASAQIPQIPTPPLPPLPSQLQPFANMVSPLSYQACMLPSSAPTLISFASSLAGVGVPVPPSMIIDPVSSLLLFDVTCTYFSPKIVPPVCDLDEMVFETTGVSAINGPQPAAIVATEAIVIQSLLAGYGVPIGTTLTDNVDGQLGCKAG